jgi:hypothetical protein
MHTCSKCAVAVPLCLCIVGAAWYETGVTTLPHNDPRVPPMKATSVVAYTGTAMPNRVFDLLRPIKLYMT